MNTGKLNTIGAALDAVMNTQHQAGAGADWGAGQPLTADTLAAAWYAGERLGGMAAQLATSAGAVIVTGTDDKGEPVKAWLDDSALGRQSADDVAMCRKFAALLRRRMAADGREVSDDSERDGAAAGVAAVVAWRNGVAPSPVVAGKGEWTFDGGGMVKGGARVSEAVAVVAWRAVVEEMSADTLGNSVEVSTVSDSWLAGDLSGDVEPLAVAVLGSLMESRSDKASRLVRERGAARRKAQLAAKLDLFKAGANSRRRELVDKIGRACSLLMDGADIDTAAAAVGFNASGQTSAGDRLARAVRALGLRFQLTLRQRGEEFAAPR